MTLQELEKASGVSARTIRYYTGIGLLPAGARGQHDPYTDVHLSLLKRIVELQGQGHSLDGIRMALATVPLPQVTTPVWSIPEHDQYRAFQVGEDVSVHVRASASVSRMRRVVRAMEMFSKALRDE